MGQYVSSPLKMHLSLKPSNAPQEYIVTLFGEIGYLLLLISEAASNTGKQVSSEAAMLYIGERE